MALILIVASNAAELAQPLKELGHSVEAHTTLRAAHNTQLDINIAEKSGVDAYILGAEVQLGGPDTADDKNMVVDPEWIYAMTSGFSWWHKFATSKRAPVITTAEGKNLPDSHVIPELEPSAISAKLTELGIQKD